MREDSQTELLSGAGVKTKHVTEQPHLYESGGENIHVH